MIYELGLVGLQITEVTNNSILYKDFNNSIITAKSPKSNRNSRISFSLKLAQSKLNWSQFLPPCIANVLNNGP